MADSIVLDGYTLNQNYHGSLTCLGVGSFGFALQATKNGEDAAVKLGHCARPDQLESARNEEIISQRLPEHQHVVRLRSFSAHDANSGPFLQSGALMSEVRAIAQQKAEIGHPFPNWMRDTQGVIRTPAIGRYCVLAFDLGGTQDLFGWYENYAHAGDTPPDTELRTVAKQMASALAHLHDHNIKHYDFKAENITVTIGSAGIITKLIDFGLARYDNIHPGLPGETGGTPMCAAPEMWAQRDAAAEQYNGPAADVWSYGVLLYSHGLGIMPFRMANSQSCVIFRRFVSKGSARRHWDERPLTWTSIRNPQTHEPAYLLLDLVDACLRLTPDARPSMQQIAQHLEANPAGSWYPAPAPAPESTSLAGSDGDSEPAFRCMGADDDAIPSPDDDAVPFPDMPPPWPRRMGALRSNILGLIE